MTRKRTSETGRIDFADSGGRFVEFEPLMAQF